MSGTTKDSQTLAAEIAAERPVAEVSDSITVPPITRSFQMRSARGTDDPLPPIRGIARVVSWGAVAFFGASFLWGAVAVVFLPQQIAKVAEEGRLSSTVGLVLLVGVLFALLTAPVVGMLSDRTRSRWGRRTPWMIAGAIAGAAGLCVLSFAVSPLSIAVVWGLSQVALLCVWVPLLAVSPDRAPRHRRAAFSAATVVGTAGGLLCGVLAAGIFAAHMRVGYIVVAALFVATVGVFVFANPDHASDRMGSVALRPSDVVRSFWVHPVAHPDYFWTFLGRLLMHVAFFLALTYVLVSSEWSPVTDGSIVSFVTGLVGVLVGAVAVAVPSDRLLARKAFLMMGCGFVAVGLFRLWVAETPDGALVALFALGFGFGSFFVIDLALVSEVLPSVATFGKDLGVMNTTVVAPLLLAPAVVAGFTPWAESPNVLLAALAFAVLAGVSVLPIRAVR